MRTLPLLVLWLLTTPLLQAELTRLEIRSREPFADGMTFGEVGQYEKIVGIAHFAVDPTHPRNKKIVDVHLAPRNKDGKVEFQADFCILTPTNRKAGNGAILYDVNNRGRKLALGMFNSAPGSNNPGKAHVGNGFLFRRGYTVVWCGWIGELLPGDNKLLMRAPVATQNGKSIRGAVRYEMVSDTPTKTMPLSRRTGHGSYPPTAKGEATGVLTWRMRETDPRVRIPNAQWSLVRRPIPKIDKGVPGTLGQVLLKLEAGFRPGYIYELVCEAQGPIVQGLGFATTRDLISFLRYDSTKNNPLAVAGKPTIDRAHGFGVSQSGRYLRNFVCDGFNADEKNRRVFDGLMPHVAGGGLGFFNFRFAQPTRHNGQHEDHLFTADRSPFTYGDTTNPFTKKSDGILRRLAREDPKLLPKIMHTQSAAEYWHRSGSLVHTDPLGKKDVAIPDNVRIYAFGGTQHGPAGNPPTRGNADNLRNPADYRPMLRALLDALDAWVKDGTAPPKSVYPRLDDNTLVDWAQRSTGFPAIPGVRYPEVIQQPLYLDHGSSFESDGILSVLPPKILGKFTVLVPKTDRDGNDLGTLLPPEVAVPRATYTGWNLRTRAIGAEGMLSNLAGSMLPFPKTKADREKTGDPRLSLEERYRDHAEFVEKSRAYCSRLIRTRYLLEEDAKRYLSSLRAE